MAKSKSSPTLKTAAGLLDWTGVRTQRVTYEPSAMIFAQGNPATSVMYLKHGAVRLSVLSHAGKEAVVAVLDAGHFFGEGFLLAKRSEWRLRRLWPRAPSWRSRSQKW